MQHLKIVIPLLILLALTTFSCKQKGISNQHADNSYLDSIPSPYDIETLNTVAFGSCSDEDLPQLYWSEIAKNKPDLWIWGGDIIYADTEDMALVRKKYQMVKQDSNYRKFEMQTAIIGTWDDHDYGSNDGNKTFTKKEESKALLLEFLNTQANSSVYSHDGVYQSFLLGSPGQYVKIVLLDTRSFQDPLEKDVTGKARYLISDGDLLGQDQWIWLENELYKNEAQVHLIMSSIQFASDKHAFEKWGNFPRSREKMLEIIINSNASNVMILSGDRHIAEISKMDVPELDYPLYDITSSGLTHSYEKGKEANAYRIGELIVEKNYGLLNLNWSEKSVRINCKIRGMNGQTYIDQDLGLFTW